MGLLDAAQQAGYPMKVSLLGDESDVSDQPEMLTQPQRYADFVATELERSSIQLVGPCVIVSPSGIGVAGPGAQKLDIAAGSNGGQQLAPRWPRSVGWRRPAGIRCPPTCRRCRSPSCSRPRRRAPATTSAG